MYILLTLFVVLALLYSTTRFYLRGENLTRYDYPVESHEQPGRQDTHSDEHLEIVDLIEDMAGNFSDKSRKERLAKMRELMDNLGGEADLSGVNIIPVDAEGTKGEWVVAENADPNRRFLYIHGGAYVMGSPLSHRNLTSSLSRYTGAAVFAVKYRLMPENKRLDGFVDCQKAYRWILDNGPNGKAGLRSMFIGGDSAGGNLTLAMIAWARDEQLRPVEAAIALSPHTDATLSSESIAANLESDHMLKENFRTLLKIPSALMLWHAWLSSGIRPCDPRVSPVHGDLSNLPPLLLHASESEALLDDSRRYVNKAKESGSLAKLETWDHMVHVWHSFAGRLPEAEEAFESIRDFLAKNGQAQIGH